MSHTQPQQLDLPLHAPLTSTPADLTEITTVTIHVKERSLADLPNNPLLQVHHNLALSPRDVAYVETVFENVRQKFGRPEEDDNQVDTQHGNMVNIHGGHA